SPPSSPSGWKLRVGEAEFALDLTPEQSQKACSLKLRLDGRLVNGRPIAWPAPARPLAPLPAGAPAATEEPAPSVGWPVIAGVVGGTNLLAGFLAWGLLNFLRRRKQQQIADVLKGFATS
ncbi:MAG: hypothetical protein ACP5IY_00395, partial [Halothiobacillaceae bacterium]